MLSTVKHTLKNGLNVIYYKTNDQVEFEISIHIKTGSRCETESNSGVSHFLEHMMFRGSKAFPNSILLARAMEKFGGEINAQTATESTTYWIKGDDEKVYDAIECFAEFFLHPNFADIEIERGVILEELASDYNDQNVCIDVEHLALKTIFNNHPLGNPILGTHDSVNKISIHDLNEKRENFYVPELCVLTIHSSEDPQKVFANVEKYFDYNWEHIKNFSRQIPVEKPILSYKHHPTKNTKNFLCLQNNQDNQYALKLVFPTVGGLTEETIRTVFLQRILDDGICTRLPGNIRELHGLVYDISCDTQFFDEVGVLGVDVTVSDDRLEDLFQKLSHEFKCLLHEAPTQEEVDHIKYRYLFDLKQIKKSPSRYLIREASAHLMGAKFSIDQESEVIKNLTPKSVHELARKIFINNYCGLALIGPKAKKHRNTVEKFLKVFTE